jgi:metal-dependent amidase/aminoacylase/carboxypeptidase family protein
MSHQPTDAVAAKSSRAPNGLDPLTASLEELYRDLHSHPELAGQEHRTAAKAPNSSNSPVGSR